MAGIVFAKLSRPLKRAETLMFSKNAVICERDGDLCLLIRIGDMRKSHILDGKIRALLVKKRQTREGETLPLYQHNVELQMECGDQQLYLFWPLIACHVINEESPLYNISYRSLKDERFELIVILEGVVESTGMSTQAKTSYLPAEIKWGHRFTPLITYQKEDGTYQIDYRLFDATYDVETPMCSAEELKRKRSEGRPIPMIKPVGYNSYMPYLPSSEQGTPMAQPRGTVGPRDSFAPWVLQGEWPAGPRDSAYPDDSSNESKSWFNWLRKRSRNRRHYDDDFSAARPSEMASLSSPRGVGGDDNHKLLAQEV